MKRAELWLAVLLLAGSFGVSAAKASDGVLLKQEDTAGSYCHMKFPAMHAKTLSTDNPTLKTADTGDVIDFYGPCNESPTGADQIHDQRQDEQRLLDKGNRFEYYTDDD
jgi:hypothetical protein